MKLYEKMLPTISLFLLLLVLFYFLLSLTKICCKSMLLSLSHLWGCPWLVSEWLPSFVSRYGHGFEMFCLASDSTRTLVASACKVSSRRCSPKTSVNAIGISHKLVIYPQWSKVQTFYMPKVRNCAIFRIKYSHFDFDGMQYVSVFTYILHHIPFFLELGLYIVIRIVNI